jgi:hypothetical protein
MAHKHYPDLQLELYVGMGRLINEVVRADGIVDMSGGLIGYWGDGRMSKRGRHHLNKRCQKACLQFHKTQPYISDIWFLNIAEQSQKDHH